jgi:hypothetical protein
MTADIIRVAHLLTLSASGNLFSCVNNSKITLQLGIICDEA